MIAFLLLELSAPLGVASQGLASGGEILRVDSRAHGASTGTNWRDAVTDLQEALAMARPGDELWIAAGCYLPTTGTDRAATFLLDQDVALYGGFAGFERLRSERDPAMNRTELSGAIGTTAIEDNSWHVLTVAPSPGARIRLDGLTITEGDAHGASKEAGGGIWIRRGTVEIKNCVLRDHRAERGGAIFVEMAGDLRIADSHFIANSAFPGNHAHGGAISCYGSMLLETTRFQSNHAEYGGGAIAYTHRQRDSSTRGEVLHCTFAENRAGMSGAIDVGAAPVTLDSCSFERNVATGGGGGAVGMSGTHAGESTMRGCRFIENEAAGVGGALAVQSRLVIDRSEFIENQAVDYGGAIYGIEDGDGLTVTNTLFYRNHARSIGGAVMLNYPRREPMRMINVTVVGNLSHEVGGIADHYGSLELINTVLWGNRDAYSGEGFEAQIFGSERYGVAFSHCVIQGLRARDERGNFGLDPRFVDPLRGDFRLRLDSPLIDRGSPDSPGWLMRRLQDLEGERRIRGAGADIGADEVR